MIRVRHGKSNVWEIVNRLPTHLSTSYSLSPLPPLLLPCCVVYTRLRSLLKPSTWPRKPSTLHKRLFGEKKITWRGSSSSLPGPFLSLSRALLLVAEGVLAVFPRRSTTTPTNTYTWKCWGVFRSSARFFTSLLHLLCVVSLHRKKGTEMNAGRHSSPSPPRWGPSGGYPTLFEFKLSDCTFLKERNKVQCFIYIYMTSSSSSLVLVSPVTNLGPRVPPWRATSVTSGESGRRVMLFSSLSLSMCAYSEGK